LFPVGVGAMKLVFDSGILADLTGWNIGEIYLKGDPGKMPKPSVWWNNLWR
jgi:hypothetical protein